MARNDDEGMIVVLYKSEFCKNVCTNGLRRLWEHPSTTVTGKLSNPNLISHSNMLLSFEMNATLFQVGDPLLEVVPS
jgi:hypothetical protein